MSVELRVLIPLSEFRHMQSLIKQSASNDSVNVVQDGGGACEKANEVNPSIDLCDSNPSQDSAEIQIPKEVIVENTPQVPTKVKGPTTAHKLLRQSDILTQVRKRDISKAKKILHTLQQYPHDFHFDSLGIVSVFGKKIPGASIFQLLQVTFNPLKSLGSPIAGQKEWLQLLRRHDLSKLISNPELISLSSEEKELDEKWYFIGPLN